MWFLAIILILVIGMAWGWSALLWIALATAALVTIVGMTATAGNRRMQRGLRAVPGITFDESWCNPKGTHAIATSSTQGKIGVFTRQGHTIHQKLFDEQHLRKVELLESGALAQRRGEMTHILRLTLAGESEPVMVPFWDGVASEDNSEWRQAVITAIDWTQHLIEIMARVAQSTDKPLPDTDIPPATPRPARAKIRRTPRVPTVQPAR